jgi:hypothetical protein
MMDVFQINLQSGAAAVESNPAINVRIILVVEDKKEYLSQGSRFPVLLDILVAMFYVNEDLQIFQLYQSP